MTKVLLKDNQNYAMITVCNAWYDADAQVLHLVTPVEIDYCVDETTPLMANSIIKQLAENETVDLTAYELEVCLDDDNEEVETHDAQLKRAIFSAFSLTLAIVALFNSILYFDIPYYSSIIPT